jgi:hypothetical protein
MAWAVSSLMYPSRHVVRPDSSSILLTSYAAKHKCQKIWKYAVKRIVNTFACKQHLVTHRTKQGAELIHDVLKGAVGNAEDLTVARLFPFYENYQPNTDQVVIITGMIHLRHLLCWYSHTVVFVIQMLWQFTYLGFAFWASNCVWQNKWWRMLKKDSALLFTRCWLSKEHSSLYISMDSIELIIEKLCQYKF